MKRHAIPALVLALSLAKPTRAAGPTPPEPPSYGPSTVVASVDGKPLTLEEVLFRYAQLPDQVREAYSSPNRGLRAFVDDLTANIAVAEEARAAKLEKEPLSVRLSALKNEDLLRDVYGRRAAAELIPEASLRARYEREKARFRIQPLVHLRQILVTRVREGRDEAAARKIAEELRGRAVKGEDFGKMAVAASEDKTAGNGGDLGWLPPSRLVPEVAAFGMSAPTHQLSPVIRSELGFHVVEVLERRAEGDLPFETVRELLFQEAIAEKRAELSAKAREQRQAITKNHRIEIHAERLPW